MLLNLKPSWLLTIVVSLFSLHTHSFSQSDLEPTFHANTKSAFIDNGKCLLKIITVISLFVNFFC